VASQGPDNPFAVTPLVPDSSFSVAGEKDGALASGEPVLRGLATEEADGPALGLAAEELEAVSIIVTFDESFDASALEAASEGKIIHRYSKVFNGASVVLAGGKVDAVASLPGVTGVYLDQVWQLDTDSSPDFIGAPAVWNALGGQENAGEGIVIGVLDSGIWPEHPSFSDPDPSGKPYPAPPGGPYGCDFGNMAWNPNDAPFTCNSKLIGAYTFLDTYKAVVGLAPYDPVRNTGEFDSARDSDGHGTHTTSTAGGNAGVDAAVFGQTYGTVSGIAPRAHVIMYRVCAGPLGSCYTSDSAAAVEQAIIDGVDALNFSIGGGGSPYSDIVSLAFLSAYENGVFVACSAGNAGPGADTVGHREPWVTTVAASTQPRAFEGRLHLEAGGDTLDLTGVSITGDFTGDVVLGADYGDPNCGQVDGVNPFPPGTFTANQIVVCERGFTARVEKSFNVWQAGAGGMIFYNPAVQSVVSDSHFVPTVHLDNEAGAVLLDFMATHTGVVGTIDGGNVVFGQGDVMAAFSSRGGPGQSLGISKPDITAPGVQILAGNTPVVGFYPDQGGASGPAGEYFQAIAGTSMASPHIAGAGALLKALHPDWTPGQIKSALMTTALIDGVVKEDGETPVDPFDVGSGRVDLNRAGSPGLTISATAQDYVDHEDDLWNSNYPSLYVPVMPGRIGVQRTVHSELSKTRCWRTSVDSPSDVTVLVQPVVCVPGGGDKTFDIIVDARNVPLGEVRHATLYLKRHCETLRFPITFVRDEPVVTLDKTCDPATFAKPETTECTITIENTSFDDAAINLWDILPRELRLVRGSTVGADEYWRRLITFEGTLYGAAPPEVTVVDGTGTTPAGYLPLSLFGIGPIAGVGDETIVNFAIPPFVFAGETYNAIGMVSNGYAVVGGGDGADVDFINQVLPDPARPNNVLAPFWTDLNPGAGGALRAATLTDGVNTWLVLDWENVPTWSGDEVDSFQIWVGLNGVEDISFTYGPVGDGDTGYLTVGAENAYGNSGQNWYVDGVGTPVAAGSEVRVSSVPGAPGETHTITFTAEGRRKGQWQNCAEMTSDVFFGTNIACFSGEVTKP
jgi:subtilisin family serine protease